VIDGGAERAFRLRLRFRRMSYRGTTHAAAGANLAEPKIGGLRYDLVATIAAANPTRATPTGGHRQVMEFVTGKHRLRIASEIIVP